jgi:hypothetical protein
VGGVIQTFYGISNLMNDAILFFQRRTSVSHSITPLKIDSTEAYPFLVFPNKNLFDNWHQEVKFRLGLPKYGRNLKSGDVYQDYIVQKFANWRKHPNKKDERVFCGKGRNLPKDLIDKEASVKYKFIEASYKDLEEMGFIKDNPDIITREIYTYNINHTQEVRTLTPLQVERSWCISPEFNAEFLLTLQKKNELRNKYIFDLGPLENGNRISIYFDKEDLLCYRIIDSIGKAYIMRFSHDLFDKEYQLNFKFAKSDSKSYMEFYINGKLIANQLFNYRIPYFSYPNNQVFIGSNINGTYCSKLRMFFADIYFIRDSNKGVIFNYDGRNNNEIFISNDEIIGYKDSSYHFMRR